MRVWIVMTLGVFATSAWAEESEESAQGGAEAEESPLPSSEEDGSGDVSEANPERVVPVDLPPVAPPVVPQSEPTQEGSEGIGQVLVSIHGDLRAVAVATRLDTLDSRVPAQQPTYLMDVPFARLGATAAMGDHVETVIGLRVDRGEVAPAWNQQGLWDAHVRVACGDAGEFSVGLMPSSFGYGESRYDWSGDWGGVDQWQPLSWAAGVAPSRVVAVSWKQNVGEVGRVDLQFAQGNLLEEGGREDQSILMRGNLFVREAVEAFVVGRMNVLGEGIGLDAEDVNVGAGLSAEAGAARLLAEFFGGSSENSAVAWGVTGAYRLPLGLKIAQEADLLLRIRDVNPTRVTEEDRLWQLAAGGTVFLKTPEGSLFSLGLIWEMDLPEDVSLAIEHELAMQVRTRF